LAYHELRDSGIQTLLILDAIGDGVCRVDTAGIITFANKAALDILGCTEQQLIGVPFVDFAFTKEDFAAAQGCAGGRRDAILRRRDGTTFPAELICIPIFSIGQTAGVVVTFADISDRKEKAVLSKMAYYDPLTQLPNRRLLTDRLSMAIASGRRRRLRLAVIFLDLDLFKQINDTLGHDAGDQVLIEVAHRLCQCVREGDTVSRLGGDEFVILQVELEDQTAAACLAERVIASIKQTMQVSGYQLNITASIGIALYPEDGSDPDTLLKCADNAMYRAKNVGRGRPRMLGVDETPVLRVAVK
jgi:diguanylate cyclase (GGDEF)-like protein/PAS domain S-box-containing protein